MNGISRRDLLKRSAVAGGVLWATPALTSGSAWGQGSTCDCDGTIIYTKIAGVAGNDAQTCNNQCIQPQNLPGISFGCLEENGYIATSQTSQEVSVVEFLSSSLSLSKMSLKVSESCYLVTCTEDFDTIWTYGNDENGFPEPKNDSFDESGNTDAVFNFYDGTGALLGTSKTGIPSGTKVRKIIWNSEPLPHKENFVEFLICAKNASRIPCTQEDC